VDGIDGRLVLLGPLTPWKTFSASFRCCFLAQVAPQRTLLGRALLAPADVAAPVTHPIDLPPTRPFPFIVIGITPWCHSASPLIAATPSPCPLQPCVHEDGRAGRLTEGGLARSSAGSRPQSQNGRGGSQSTPSLRILSVQGHFIVKELESLRNGNLRFFLDFGRPIE